MKYPDFKFKGSEKIFVFEDAAIGNYEVYKVDSLGRWYLVKKGKSLAWKNYNGKDLTIRDVENWTNKWYDNALKQTLALGNRIHELHAEQDEIMGLLARESIT